MQVSRRNRCKTFVSENCTFHIVTSLSHNSRNFFFVKCGGYIICAVLVESRPTTLHGCVCVSQKLCCQISPSCTQPDVARSSVKHLVSVSMSKHKRVVGAEFLSSGSPQGLSSPMLVVIFLSRHCSLLCSPSFLIILSAIYQTMKSERKKKLNLSFLCIMAYVKFFEEKCFVCSLFPCRKKKKLVVCRNYPNLFFNFVVVLLFSFNSQRGFQ